MTSSPSSGELVPPGGGELLGDGPDRRVLLLCDGDALHTTWSRFGPGRDGADLHVHREHTDLFFVLDGELTLRLGPQGDPVLLPEGTLALVPPLVVHGFRNAGAVDVRYLNLHAPGRGFAAYMRGRRDGRPVAYDQHEPPSDGGRSPGEVQLASAEAAGPPVQVLAEDEHVVVRDVRCAAGAALDRPPGPTPVHEALFVLGGEVAVGGGRAEEGAWVDLPAGAQRSIVASDAADARVLHVAVRGAATS